MNDIQKTEQRVERGPRAPAHPLAVECLYDDECKTLMSKGHHDPAEFTGACERWNGGPITGWGKVRHVWLRNTPDSSGDYEFRVFPARQRRWWMTRHTTTTESSWACNTYGMRAER